MKKTHSRETGIELLPHGSRLGFLKLKIWGNQKKQKKETQKVKSKALNRKSDPIINRMKSKKLISDP